MVWPSSKRNLAAVYVCSVTLLVKVYRCYVRRVSCLGLCKGTNSGTEGVERRIEGRKLCENCKIICEIFLF